MLLALSAKGYLAWATHAGIRQTAAVGIDRQEYHLNNNSGICVETSS